MLTNPHVQGFFDGGAAGQVGTGGFIIFDESGKCIVAQAMYYGENWNTNNRSEVHALCNMMTWLEMHPSAIKNVPAIIVYGDS